MRCRFARLSVLVITLTLNMPGEATGYTPITTTPLWMVRNFHQTRRTCDSTCHDVVAGFGNEGAGGAHHHDARCISHFYHVRTVRSWAKGLERICWWKTPRLWDLAGLGVVFHAPNSKAPYPPPRVLLVVSSTSA
ncbi:hypothetical protein EV363DRAFT_1321128 [Boletus edulis]|uniref:Secreted protein n=1 Tax=Boletus edulis BED1 TaxID=1328754 RepID=A0AAD4BVL5_BOLED|nr:hypothetical protein EV363DRAFT_1321128 [Boletus edulis]KAF8441399.1 hypothetical protein L210DRAFT_3537120 [Boletus edulis BED1]